MRLTRRYRSRMGAALVITLVFIVMITVLILAMEVSVQLDRPAANSHWEKARAAQFAQTGIEQVVALLRQNSASTNLSWVSSPGQLIVASGTDHILNTTVSLFSGTANTNLTGVFQPPALNLPSFQDPASYLITSLPDSSGGIPAMRVKWIYVRQSGATDSTDTPDAGNKADPLVGRYAYWVDDESSRVNVNLAWKRGMANTNLPGHPTKTDLSALPNVSGSVADSLHNFIATDLSYGTLNHGFFNSPKDVRRVGASVASALAPDQFLLTYYNHDPDTSVFGEPRIVLTTQKSKAGGQPFLDILTTDNIDPGDIANIDSTKLNNILFGTNGIGTSPKAPGLVKYLSRADWPMVTNSSFQKKYYTGNSAQLAANTTQLALSIIEYVRCKESTNTQVVPIRSFLSGSGTQSLGSGSVDSARNFCITEMGMWIAATNNPVSSGPSTRYLFPAVAKVEVYLPAGYGIASVDLTKMSELIQVDNSEGFQPATIGGPIAAADCAPSSTVVAGSYATITHAFTLDWGTNSSNRPTVVPMRAGISVGGSALTNFVDLCPTAFAQTNDLVQVPIDNVGVTTNAISSMETDDPRINKNRMDWQRHMGATSNSFGGANSVSTLGSVASGTYPGPQQDTDANNHLTDASLYMPPPKGMVFTNPATGVVDDNMAGAVYSTAELGFVDTGILTTTNGIPWRTLRLQPNAQAASVLPDWALLDIFTVPRVVNSNAAYVYQPHATSAGGRVNINASLAPFSLDRYAPLSAVLLGCATNHLQTNAMSLTQAQAVAQNIYSRKLASSGKLYGATNFFGAPGEVAEIQGVADGGEASEELVRQISSLITTRGDVVGIYTIGQSLKQAPGGTFVVTGEERLQALVERYVDATANPNAVKFRTVFFRNLTP